MLDAFAKDGFDVFPGSETFLLAGLRSGGKGCISATANVNPAAIRKLYAEWQSDAADEQQRGLDRIRGIFQKYPMIAAMKRAIAHWSGHAAWATVRPPLVELGDDQAAALIAALTECGFSMPGLKD